MSTGDMSHRPCPWCRRPVPEGAQRCPHCGREPQTEDLRPMGGDLAGASAGAPAPWAETPVPPVRDPLAALERRRAEKAAQSAKWVRLSHAEYVRFVLREDQVFAALVGLFAFQAILSLINVARTDLSSPFLISGLAWFALRCVMAIGLLTFQRWVHTALVWAAGLSIAWGVLSTAGLLLAPLRTQSGIQLLMMWVQWVVGIAGGLFMLVVLSERTAYFEGVASRLEPKRTRLRDFLDREYWRKANAPRDYEQHEADSRPRIPAPVRPPPPAPQAPPSDLEGLRPFGGGHAPDLLQPPPRPTRPAEQPMSYRVDPLPPAPGQQDGPAWGEMRERTRWASVAREAREDRLFAALLAALALQTVLVIATLKPLAILGALALFWAVMTRQLLGFWFGLGPAAVLALSHIVMLRTLLAAGGQANLLLLVYAATTATINVFIAGALWARRDRFE